MQLTRIPKAFWQVTANRKNAYFTNRNEARDYRNGLRDSGVSASMVRRGVTVEAPETTVN